MVGYEHTVETEMVSDLYENEEEQEEEEVSRSGGKWSFSNMPNVCRLTSPFCPRRIISGEHQDIENFQVLPERFKSLAPYLLASMVYHKNFLSKILSALECGQLE